jgi:hypothetical protein
LYRKNVLDKVVEKKKCFRQGCTGKNVLDKVVQKKNVLDKVVQEKMF